MDRQLANSRTARVTSRPEAAGGDPLRRCPDALAGALRLGDAERDHLFAELMIEQPSGR